MRTTITLTPDADAIIRRVMAERGMTFKEAVNDVILRSARNEAPVDIVWPTFDLDLELDPVDANRFLADLETADQLSVVQAQERSRTSTRTARSGVVA
ncbi:hypothetical protein [Salana multivorans]